MEATATTPEAAVKAAGITTGRHTACPHRLIRWTIRRLLRTGSFLLTGLLVAIVVFVIRLSGPLQLETLEDAIVTALQDNANLDLDYSSAWFHWDREYQRLVFSWRDVLLTSMQPASPNQLTAKRLVVSFSYGREHPSIFGINSLVLLSPTIKLTNGAKASSSPNDIAMPNVTTLRRIQQWLPSTTRVTDGAVQHPDWQLSAITIDGSKTSQQATILADATVEMSMQGKRTRLPLTMGLDLWEPRNQLSINILSGAGLVHGENIHSAQVRGIYTVTQPQLPLNITLQLKNTRGPVLTSQVVAAWPALSLSTGQAIEGGSVAVSLKTKNATTTALPAFMQRWWQKYVPSGVIRHADFIGVIPLKTLDFQRLSGTVSIKDAVVTYSKKTPPITNVRGVVDITAPTLEQLQVTVRRATGNSGPLTTSLEKLTWHDARQKLTVNGVIKGPITNQLAIAQKFVKKPLLPDNADATGNSKTTLNLELQRKNIDVAVKAALKNATLTMPKVTLTNLAGVLTYGTRKDATNQYIGKVRLKNVPLSVTYNIDTEDFTARLAEPTLAHKVLALVSGNTGTATPYVAGNITGQFKQQAGKMQGTLNLSAARLQPPLLAWKKTIGTPAELSFREDAKGIITGTLTSGANNENGLTFSYNDSSTTINNLRLGNTSIRRIEYAKKSSNKVPTVTFTAEHLAIPVPTKQTATAPQKPLAVAAIKVAGTISKATIGESLTLTKVTIAAQQPKTGPVLPGATATLTGQLNGQEFTATLESDRSLTIKSPDAGATLNSLDITRHMRGGTLSLSAKVQAFEPLHLTGGQLMVKGYRLVKTPLLAEILASASITGPLELLGGPGVPFHTLAANYTYQLSQITIARGRMLGNGVGLHGEGVFNLASRTADISGTIVPFNMLNSLPGKIPVLGEIFGGKNGEGLIALRYTAKGPIENPKVSVNPLSALTPGYLRQLFE